jgi:hypothetical protein
MRIAEILDTLDEHVARAVSAVAADGGASPVLAGVVEEFQRKLAKSRRVIADADEDLLAVREAVVELEQAGDSAKMAALADPGVSASVRDAVIAAHDVICEYKASPEAQVPRPDRP